MSDDAPTSGPAPDGPQRPAVQEPASDRTDRVGARRVPAGDFTLDEADNDDGSTRRLPDGPGPAPADGATNAGEGSTDIQPPPPARPRDPNVDAIARAGLPADVDNWLREVAAQVDPRLDRVAPGWREQPQSGAARACVFGVMLGRLANDYPHTSGDLGRVAETHASFATLTAGSRLATLREIADDRGRGAAWIGPLVGLDDPSPLRDLLD